MLMRDERAWTPWSSFRLKLRIKDQMLGNVILLSVGVFIFAHLVVLSQHPRGEAWACWSTSSITEM